MKEKNRERACQEVKDNRSKILDSLFSNAFALKWASVLVLCDCWA